MPRRREIGPSTRWPGRSWASGRRRSRSRTGSAAWRSGRWSRSPGAAVASRPTSSRSRASLEALAGQLGVELSFAAATEPFLHPGRAAAVEIAGVAGRLDRRGPPAGLPRVGPRGRGRLRNRHRGAGRRRQRRRGDLRGRHHLPGRPPGPRRRRPGRGQRGRGPRRGPGGRRRAAALGPGLRPLRGRAARRGPQEPGAAARVPRRRPHPHRRGGRRPCGRRSRRSWSRSEGSLRE